MKSRPRDVAIACLTSGILHAGVLAGVIIMAVPLLVPTDWTAVNTAVDEESPGVEADQLIRQDVESIAPESAASPETDSRRKMLDALADADLGNARIAEFARRKLEQARAAADEKSMDEQLADLESLGRQLNRVSSQESVAAVAEAIAPLIGSGSRASEPAVDGDDSQPFDAATAQFYEVHRQGEEGAYEYSATMLDAAGQTREVPLDAADGESLYDLFQMMKKFPLLETVYRKAALGLLDTIMAEERVELFSEADDSEETQQPASEQSDQEQN